MALVDYSSSDEDEISHPLTEQPPSNFKRKRNDEPSDLPPLPSKFHDLYASTTRVSTRDDPSMHGGRKRVTPHIEGNWPTHLYIEWYPLNAEYGPLTKLISWLKDKVGFDDVAPKIHSFLTSDLGVPLPLHISLSRPIGFATDQKDEFSAALVRAINSSGIRPFHVGFSHLDWVANFDKTRWFLVLRLTRPDSDGLNKLLHVSNRVVQDYGQPPLYTSPRSLDSDTKTEIPGKKRPKADWVDMEDISNSFHISIAWTLGPPSAGLLESTKAIAAEHIQEITQVELRIEEVKSKVGNVVTSIPLPKSVLMGKGLFGA